MTGYMEDLRQEWCHLPWVRERTPEGELAKGGPVPDTWKAEKSTNLLRLALWHKKEEEFWGLGLSTGRMGLPCPGLDKSASSV